MAPLDGPTKLSEMPTPEEVIAVSKKDETVLKGEVLELQSPGLKEIVQKIETSDDTSAPIDVLKVVTEGVAALSAHIKNKDWSKAFEGFTSMIKEIFGSGPIKPSYWDSSRDSRKGKEEDFSIEDMKSILAKVQSGSYSPEKELALSRLISRRRDADHELKAKEEPGITEEYLMAQVNADPSNIRVGDMMIFGGPIKGEKMKTAVLETGVKSKHTHAAVITSVDPLEITHATAEGVHTVSLMEYIKKHELVSYAVISGGGQKSSDYALAQIGKKYDLKNALANQFGDEETMFCSELAIRAFAEGHGLNIDDIEKEGKIFPPHLLALSYPTYVGDYPREISG